MSFYELVVIGNPSSAQLSQLEQTIVEMTAEFGLRLRHEIGWRDASNLDDRDIKASTAALYFGGATDGPSLAAMRSLIKAKLPVIPVVGEGGDVEDEIPEALRFANAIWLRADDPRMLRIANALLEATTLLRKQRRVFLSYRREEATPAALQLHDELTHHGFDVFLDTASVGPGEDFQSVLWHRLCDSDVLLMLETADYFGSRWTSAEWGRAHAAGIHFAQVVWPGLSPSRMSRLAQPIHLATTDLESDVGPMTHEALNRVRLLIEAVRSRSIAARYMAISGALRSEAEGIGASVEPVGTHHAMNIELADGRKFWAYPMVGVPTADMLNEVARRAGESPCEGVPLLAYDHIGISEEWLQHLEWLDENIRAVRALSVRGAGWRLADWTE